MHNLEDGRYEYRNKQLCINDLTIDTAAIYPGDMWRVPRLLDGDIVWFVNSQLHRTDGPALISTSCAYWYYEGQLHRNDSLPAIEHANGYKHWYVNGKRHRTDGPAAEYANGNKKWYINDKLHRTDGPAVEFAIGDKIWYIAGCRHRTDGPAVECVSGDKLWYIDGKEMSFNEFIIAAKWTDEQVVLWKLEPDSKCFD